MNRWSVVIGAPQDAEPTGKECHRHATPPLVTREPRREREKAHAPPHWVDGYIEQLRQDEEHRPEDHHATFERYTRSFQQTGHERIGWTFDMFRSRVLAALALVALTSCQPPDSALRVTIEVRPQGTALVFADCLKLRVLNPAGEELLATVFPRPDDNEAIVAVKRGSNLPASIQLQVSGLIGNCQNEDSLKLNTRSEPETFTFPESGVADASLTLGPPDQSLDRDRDGYASATEGGPDCNDMVRTIFPGAMQTCSMHDVDTDCDGTAGCDDAECNGAPVCANPPTKLVMTPPATPALDALDRHGCYGPFTFQLQNESGARIAVRETPLTLAPGLAGLTFHDASNCMSSAVTSYRIAYGTDSVQLYMKTDGVARGVANVVVTAARVATPATYQVRVRALPATQLVVTSPDVVTPAGACSAQTIDFELRDAQGRRTDAEDSTITVPLSVTRGSDPVANMLFSDGACGTGVSNLSFAPGVGVASVHVLNTRAASYSVRASASPFDATDVAVITAASPSRLLRDSPSYALSPAVCLPGGIRVSLVDAFDNPASAPANATLTITPAAPIGDVTFHEHPDCQSNATNTVPFGDAGTIYARGDMVTVGSAVISTDIPNVQATEPFIISVGAGAPSRVDFGGTGQTILAGGCSTMGFPLQLQDNVGNPTNAPDGGFPVTLTASTGSIPSDDLRFFTDPSCDPDAGRPNVVIPAGRPGVTVYFGGTRARPSFTFAGTSALPVMGDVPGNVINPQAPEDLFVTPASASALAGGCAGYTAELRDTFGNLTSFSTTRARPVASTRPSRAACRWRSRSTRRSASPSCRRCRRAASARPSVRTPMASSSVKAPASWCSSASKTRSVTATRFTLSFAASACRMTWAAACCRPTRKVSCARCGRRTRRRAGRRPTCSWWNATARARRAVTGSSSRVCRRCGKARRRARSSAR